MLPKSLLRSKFLCLSGVVQRSAFCSRQSKSSTKSFKNGSVKVTELTNGLLVASCDVKSALSYVSLIFNAGVRYQNFENRGIVHRLRDCLGFNTKTCSPVKLSYDLALLGAQVESTASRDYLSFDLQCVRDRLPSAFLYLNEIVTKPAYEPWICEETNEQVQVEVELGLKDMAQCLNDLVHAAAYRLSPMAYSLLCPSDMIGVHNSEMLQKYASEHLIASSNALVGVGVEHDLLLYLATDKLTLPEGKPPKPVPAVYFGGERFMENSSTRTHFALAHNGVNYMETKDAICQMLLCKMLSDKSRTALKDSSQSRLVQTLSKRNFKPFEVSSFNYVYSDTGVFGVRGSCAASDSHDFVLAAMEELHQLGEKGPTEQDLNIAKQKVQADGAMQSENMKRFSQNFATQVIARKHDLYTDGEIVQMIDSIQPSDIVRFASKTLKSTLSIAACGRLDTFPLPQELK